MKIFNTQTKKKEEFVPVKKGEVSIYLCGPTVYDYFHIGNARAFIVFDSFRRFLEYKGYKVKYVTNLTDVDDKILKKSEEEKIEPSQVAQKYIKAFFEDTERLKIKPADYYPKATEHIEDMIDLVKKLIDKGYAYKVNGDVFFEVKKYKDYGLLSGKRIDELLSGARIGIDKRKKNPLDFSLWKSWKGESVFWDSPWGKGRPGWHLECSVMSVKYLGKEFDIHAGGEDLIFPHHENEFAQSRCGYGGNFARYWMHNGFLKKKKKKMSKSLGNFVLAREILNKFKPEAIRLFFFQKHYRKIIDYEPELLQDAENAIDKLNRTYYNIINLTNDVSLDRDLKIPELISIKNKILTHLEDDFDTPGAIAKIFELNKIANTILENGDLKKRLPKLRKIAEFYKEFDSIFGFLYKEEKKGLKEEKLIEILLEIRQILRNKKLFELSDKIRDELNNIGIEIEDTKEGSRWRKI